jgi:hypothetical protein
MRLEAARIRAMYEGRISHALREHKALHFDTVLEALERLDTMCREDARFMVTSDGSIHDFVEQTIAEAREMKT